MRERPILFSIPMVQAILDGRKSMTRRVVKFNKKIPPDMMEDQAQFYCPYGQVGDHLWVREKFYAVDMPDMGDVSCLLYQDEFDKYQQSSKGLEIRPCGFKFGCHPSIHLPRIFSRITLEITNVRVERLQDITEEDAISEGIPSIYAKYSTTVQLWSEKDKRYLNGENHKSVFHQLWDSINGKKYPWSSDPWVWVIEFKKA